MSLPVPTYDDLTARAQDLVALAAGRGETIVTAESCTGGLLAAFLTEVAGSSKVLERGFVTYSNEAKSELLDVPISAIATQGAVSETVARSMASGALAASRASVVISITGIAGPGGGSPEKPIGLVHFGGARAGLVVHRRMQFGALDRRAIRFLSVATAFDLLTAILTGGAGQDTP